MSRLWAIPPVVLLVGAAVIVGAVRQLVEVIGDLDRQVRGLAPLREELTGLKDALEGSAATGRELGQRHLGRSGLNRPDPGPR